MNKQYSLTEIIETKENGILKTNVYEFDTIEEVNVFINYTSKDYIITMKGNSIPLTNKNGIKPYITGGYI